ncbi:HEAT repeat domain-containing protein [Kitasatospora aureofaciens]|uniref:HEAT repeat domain-containing protein n=1 Tax=Kitasatospora aureofaciens TaxID=1894 RepID=UPI001C4580E2|nr:HEAT repeat domain-containing protein [Kitasatospora aureofaciens]MBV6702326.1 HEAT repeat domain-containing protein [Kitasatospora aureofaciens]
MIGLLGAIVESTDECGVTVPGAPCSAGVAQLPLLVPLLGDDDREVRQCVAWAVAQCRPGSGEPGQAQVITSLTRMCDEFKITMTPSRITRSRVSAAYEDALF